MCEFVEVNAQRRLSELSDEASNSLCGKISMPRRRSEPNEEASISSCSNKEVTASSKNSHCKPLRRNSYNSIKHERQRSDKPRRRNSCNSIDIEHERKYTDDETSVTSIDTYFKASDPFLLLNIDRADLGIPMLSKSPILENAAKTHAMNMAKFDGLYYFAAELIRKNNGGHGRRPLKEIIAHANSVACVHEMMMNLSHERSNMLSSAYSFVGVGIAKCTHDVYYACYLFC